MPFSYLDGQKQLTNIVEAVLWIRIGLGRQNPGGQKWMRSSRMVNAKVATVLGSIPASSDTVESEGGRRSSVDYRI